MVNDKELGALIARHIFQVIDNGMGADKCQRLAGRGGIWPDHETDMGGLDERALSGVIADALSKHRSY